MKKTMKNRGITLIALVITIIILLILAGVSIAMLTGNNGILTQAENSKILTEFKEIKEYVGLKKNEKEILKVQSDENEFEKQNLGIPYTDENPYGPINVWGYDTFFGDGWYLINGEVTGTNTEKEYIVNYDNGYVLSKEKFSYNGKEVYTLDEVSIKQVASKGWDLFILRSDGTLWGSGANIYGELGIGNTEKTNAFKQVNISNVKEITISIYTTFAIKENNDIYAWGMNNKGQLGIGTIENCLKPVKINESNIKKIYACSENTFIEKNDGTIMATGNYVNIPKSDRSSLGDITNVLEYIPITIDNVKKISGAYGHTLVLKNDNTVYGIGVNINGKLGNGNEDTRWEEFTKIPIDNVKDISVSNEFSLILKNDGTLWGAGMNTEGQLWIGDKQDKREFSKGSLEGIKELKHNYGISYAITDNNEIYVCGSNKWGESMLGHKDLVLEPTKIERNDIKEIIAAGSTTYFFKNDGTLWGVGQNLHGQMGIGKDEEFFLEPVKIDFIK